MGLPEAEFLELYNPTDKIIGLGEVVLTDATGQAQLPSTTIFPNEYLILTATSTADDYVRFGRTLGVSGMPSLNNTGEPLTLQTISGDLIFSITYSDDWYRDSEKKDGGFSLEMIDTSNPCGEESNWRASEASQGGTPGAENSITGNNPDNRSPKLEKAFVENVQTVLLRFDEKLALDQLQFATFEIDNGITISGVEVVSDKEVRLRLATELQIRTVYTVTVGNATDCLGNLIGEENTATFVLPETGETGDIILNEILFNPPVGGTDFVELYNRSEKYISLQGWQLANLDSDGQINAPKTLSEEVLVIEPNEYYAFNEDNGQLLLQYPNGRSERFVEMDVPTYSDTEGEVILLNPANEVFDRFDYLDDFQFGLIPDDEGVSLERISFDAPTNDPNNWQSAAATAGFGTPGYLNSQNLENPNNAQLDDCFSLSHEVFSPDGDGFRDFVQINYECDAVGQVVSIAIYDVRGRKIRRLVDNQTLAVSGSLTWDGIREDGEKAKVGYYIILIDLFDLNGNTRTIQKKVVVGAKF